ncbi:MAG TPA: M48 family metalloprotease [Pseudomonadales bacterium]|nr:M48 family metalloprotease [Pseudomonadales bacterium]
MTREEFDYFIQKLEGASRKNPRLYIARIIALVALAYLYLLVILLGSLALCLLMIVMVIYVPATIKLAIIGFIAFGGVFLAISRGLWVKLDPPGGEAVTQKQAPKLFTLLEELRMALDCKPFYRVLITGEVNAGVYQVPRLGIFGWHRNYLVIGLPLMQVLAPDEFKAVLAHEFAHSSRGHGRFGNWLYRMRRTWAQIFDQMAKRRTRFGGIVFKFLNWFWPIFNGHAFVLARANEYEADACSVRLAGADAAAGALIRSRVDGAFLSEKFWPDTLARVNHETEPPSNVMPALGHALKNGPPAQDAARWLRQSYSVETNNADTHPCLKDRLRAIGQLPPEIEHGKFPDAPMPAPAQNAAEFFLGDYATVIAQKLSDDWKKAIMQQWKTRHEQMKKIAGELEGLEKTEDAQPPVAQIWERVLKTIELRGDSAAVTMLEQIVALEPKHAGANFILGRHYLETDDSRGVNFIEIAIASDPAIAQRGCHLLHNYYNRTGQRDKLRPLENRFDEFEKLNRLAQQERARISVTDTFIPHALTEQQIAALRAVFSAEADIVSAAVAQKKLQYLPDSPCYAIALRMQTSWLKTRSSQASQQIVHRIAKQTRLPGHFTVFVDEKNLRSLGAEIFHVPGSVVYERPKN